MRIAELDATQIAQAHADASRVRIEAEASADAEAIRIRRIADATAESIQKVNQAIQAGGDSYFRYRQIEMLPQIAPAIAEALAEAKMVTFSSGGSEGGAAEATTNNITSVIQTVLAAQMVSKGLLDSSNGESSVPVTRVTVPQQAPKQGK
jgi:flotillin